MIRQPWICTEFLEACNERDELQKKAKTSNSACDKIIANRASNRTVFLKWELKRLFFQTSIQDAHGDSGKLWKALKRLLQNTTNKNSIISINDKTDPTEIVSELNNFFANIGQELARNIEQSNMELNFENKPDIPFLHLQETDKETVKKSRYRLRI